MPRPSERFAAKARASAAAIYGSKASNGVVIITTKRGRYNQEGTPQIQFAQRVGFYQLSNELGSRKFNSVEEAVEVFGEKARSAYVEGQVFNHERELAGRTAPSRETTLSASGSLNDGRTTYFASGLLRDDQGIDRAELSIGRGGAPSLVLEGPDGKRFQAPL